MYKLFTVVLSFMILSCSNSPTSSQLSMSDMHAIEAVSAGLTNMQIDSIVRVNNWRALVYYKSDMVDTNVSTYSYLQVFNLNSIDTSSFNFSKPVLFDSWISDSTCLTRKLKITMHFDSVQVSVITSKTMPVDTLRTVLLYLSDLTVCDTALQYLLDPTFCDNTPKCDFEVCYKVPLDSMTSISWYHKQDTTFIGMNQRKDNYSGISWTFRLFEGMIKLVSRSKWIS